MKIVSTSLRRFALTSLALAAAGCASGTAGPHAPGGVTTVTIRGADYAYAVPRLNEPGIRSDEIPAAAERVFTALAASYTALGIPLNTVEPEARTVGATRARLRRIGERSIAEFFDCGGAFGNAAARFNVYVTVTSQAVPSGSASTSLRSVVTANAKSSTHSTEVVCNSTKKLEALIAEEVRVKLAAG